VKCQFVHRERINHEIGMLCFVLDIARATYYRWLQNDGLPSQKQDAQLLSRITEHFSGSDATYGARRVHAALRKIGIRVSRARVSRIMQEHDLHAVHPKRRVRTTNSKHEYPIAENLLDRNFSPDTTGLNCRWTGDVTYIDTKEGWLYLAVILDLASRRVVGYAMSANNDRHLVLDALRMAAEKRPNRSAKLIFHSDRGSTYAATECRQALESLGIQCSMSDVGECLDNATTESFNATIKRELIDRHEWKSHDDVAVAVVRYIEQWYNPRRLHSSLKYQSPVEREIALITAQANTGGTSGTNKEPSG
jgi:putative transposase